ncbi:MAG: CpsD/CapB family tyrosine-protein kinase [Clostridia bacterium]|nr:CpsD/CapB family tyrosine-protein kinase [Clostridia bacterium]
MLFKKIKNFNRAQEISEAAKMGADLDFSTAEAYNLLRTNLFFAFPGKIGGRCIGITSPAPSEGKSFTAINLAYSLAKDGQKVLLVDGDMRKPTIADKLHLKPNPGLSNQLVDRGGMFVQESEMHENFFVLTAGNIPPNPSELIGSDEMRNVLGEYAKQYDYVIVDLPPVMEVPDPLIMAKNLDGIVITVRHERSYRNEIKETVRKLQFANAHILGFVYNGYSNATPHKRGKKHYAYKSIKRK